MSDETTPQAPADNAANLCSWLIVITGLLLLIAIHTIQTVQKDHYNSGWYGQAK